jgi:hypothetical protein
MEEHNSQGFTALHVALQYGHSNIIKLIFESYPPKESDSKKIYMLPPSKSLLSLALDSREPEVVWMVLETKGLATSEEISNAWTKVSSAEFKLTKPGQKKPTPEDEEKLDDIRNLLMGYGGFTPPPTPKVGAKNDTRWKAAERPSTSYSTNQRFEQSPSPKPKPKNKQKQKKKEGAGQNVDQLRPPLGQLPSQSHAPNQTPVQQQKTQRGHERGKSRSKATI